MGVFFTQRGSNELTNSHKMRRLRAGAKTKSLHSPVGCGEAMEVHGSSRGGFLGSLLGYSSHTLTSPGAQSDGNQDCHFHSVLSRSSGKSFLLMD